MASFAGELAVGSRARLLAERGLQVADHEASLGPIEGRAGYPDGPRDLLVTGASIRSQQNLRALELARRVPAAAQGALEFIAFGLAEFDPMTMFIRAPCSLEARMNN
jgi:hypothetical protein